MKNDVAIATYNLSFEQPPTIRGLTYPLFTLVDDNNLFDFQHVVYAPSRTIGKYAVSNQFLLIAGKAAQTITLDAMDTLEIRVYLMRTKERKLNGTNR